MEIGNDFRPTQKYHVVKVCTEIPFDFLYGWKLLSLGGKILRQIQAEKLIFGFLFIGAIKELEDFSSWLFCGSRARAQKRDLEA